MGILPNPGIQLRFRALQTDSLLSEPPREVRVCVCVCVCIQTEKQKTRFLFIWNDDRLPS